eukprot:g18295.t1
MSDQINGDRVAREVLGLDADDAEEHPENPAVDEGLAPTDDSDDDEDSDDETQGEDGAGEFSENEQDEEMIRQGVHAPITLLDPDARSYLYATDFGRNWKMYDQDFCFQHCATTYQDILLGRLKQLLYATPPATEATEWRVTQENRIRKELDKIARVMPLREIIVHINEKGFYRWDVAVGVDEFAPHDFGNLYYVLAAGHLQEWESFLLDLFPKYDFHIDDAACRGTAQIERLRDAQLREIDPCPAIGTAFLARDRDAVNKLRSWGAKLDPGSFRTLRVATETRKCSLFQVLLSALFDQVFAPENRHEAWARCGEGSDYSYYSEFCRASEILAEMDYLLTEGMEGGQDLCYAISMDGEEIRGHEKLALWQLSRTPNAMAAIAYVDEFQLNVNCSHRIGDRELRLMDYVLDDPSGILALMCRGARCPTIRVLREGVAEQLQDLAENQQNIHAGPMLAAIRKSVEKAQHYLAKKKDAPATNASSSSRSMAEDPVRALSGKDVAEAVSTFLSGLTAAQLADYRKLQPHCARLTDEDILSSLVEQLLLVKQKGRGQSQTPQGNGLEALALIHNFMASRYPSENPLEEISKALLQAGHEYGPRRQSCDPLRMVQGILLGRTDDLEEKQATAQEEDAAPVANALEQYLGQLQKLSGASDWQLMEEGQRLLVLLSGFDRRGRVLNDWVAHAYHLIVEEAEGDLAETYLRGFFVQQLLLDFLGGSEPRRKYGRSIEGLNHLPEGLHAALRTVDRIAEMFVRLFTRGDLMRDAFKPFLEETRPRAEKVAGSTGEKEDGGAAPAPAAKKQKIEK